MNKKAVLMIAVISLAGFVTAQTVSDVEPNPGVIKAGSPFYSLDIAYDNAFKSDGEQVYERASEYSYAQERNRTEAMDRANKSLGNAISRVASSNETEGLEKAEAVLQQVKNRTPDQANAGIERALGNVQKARNGTLKPEDVGKPSDVGNPDGDEPRESGMPDNAGR